MKVLIIALEYLEPYYTNTMVSLSKVGGDVVVKFADRKGAGSLSSAFNRAFVEFFQTASVDEYYVWFITDISFDINTLRRLKSTLDKDLALAAVHPEHNSDHVSHRPTTHRNINYVPYIEFTAPMVRAKVFQDLGMLDEHHWYWYQDLLFSKAVRDAGGMLAVDHGARVNHVYHRVDKKPYPITQRRYRIRAWRDKREQALLEKRFGANWRQILWAT